MEIVISKVVFSTVNFIILYFILKHFLFKPVNNVIESREKAISETLMRTKQDSEAAVALRLEREKSLRLLEDEGKKIIENYKLNAEKLSKEIILEAKEEAKLAMDRARTEIHLAEEKAKEELKTEAISLALIFAEKALAGSLDEAMHAKLINDFIIKADK